MDTNSTNETYSTNESQDISSSQQSSEANLSQCGLEEGNSVASSTQESHHDEVVNSVIMEVSGELMLGNFSSRKYPSGGSESSDISDDDSRRVAAGGAIAKYPESSTGMSDNDWNPYATESDTNQTPRSAASDEQRFIPKEPLTTVSMITGEVITSPSVDTKLQPEPAIRAFSDEYRIVQRTESESYKPCFRQDITDPASQGRTAAGSERLDILRYMVDDDLQKEPQEQERLLSSDINDRQSSSNYRPANITGIVTGSNGRDDEMSKSMESTKSSRSDNSDPSQKSQGGFSRESEETLKGRDSSESARSLQLHGTDVDAGRQSVDSGQSGAHSRRESGESVRSHFSEEIESRTGRQSLESNRSDEFRRESAESYRSLPTEGYGGRSDKLILEADRSPRSGCHSAESWKSPRSELDKSGESRSTGRESAESQHSLRSDRSRGSENSGRSQKSYGSAGSAYGTDRLDRLNEVGDNIKELIQFESAQRQVDDNEESERISARQGSPSSDAVSRRVKLTANFEAYTAPTRSSTGPARSGNTEYVSVAERERLLCQSPDYTAVLPQAQKEDVSYKLKLRGPGEQTSSYSSVRVSDLPVGGRSPSEVSMKRVSDLFEETKKQTRAAVSLPRPDPFGSEERFPLRERLSLSQHADDSYKSQDKTGHSEKSRDSETARSITSEEVARVLGKYADMEADLKRARLAKDEENREPGIKVSAFETFDRNVNAVGGPGTDGNFDATRTTDMTDDEIAKRVRAILSDTEYLGIMKDKGRTLQSGELQGNIDPSEKYVLHTIDYSKLQRDLQEIQDSLHEVPPPKANDSLYQFRQMKESAGDRDHSGTSESGHFKSAETTSTSGRESGISNYGRKLAWDHGADLQYDEGCTGQFLGTMASLDTDTLTERLRKSGTLESDNLIVRADSTTTNETENDARGLSPEDTVTAAQSIVDQVLSRHAEGPLQENVEDIIARYRNERQDLFDRFQPTKDSLPDKVPKLPKEEPQRQPAVRQQATQLSSAAPVTTELKPGQNGNVQPGLAERVYKILTSDQQQDSYKAPPAHLEQGMAKKVYKILSSDRPGHQVNGILSEAMEKEHEMLKKLVQQQESKKDEPSLEEVPRLNGTSDSFALSEKDVRRQLEWSLLSSPDKADKTGLSDISTIRKVTKAPYSSVDNAKTLLSSQLQKMSERNFDKSVELRTPFRQAINCYPVYEVERDGKKQDKEQEVKEAWMPVPNPSRLSPEKAGEKKPDALASERFFLTAREDSPVRSQGERRIESPQRHRTFSDPFDIPPSRRTLERGHPRSKSEEGADVSDLSQYSFDSPRYDPTNRRAASSAHWVGGRGSGTKEDVGLMTPAKHMPQAFGVVTKAPQLVRKSRKQEWSYEPYSGSDSSDLYYHSDSSESQGNKWHYHGYQLYKPKENYKAITNKYPVKNHSFSTVQEFEKNCVSCNSSVDHKSRHNRKESGNSNAKVKFRDDYKLKSDSGNDRFEPIKKKPMISKDDVYDLLSKSRAQENKVAELWQTKDNHNYSGHQPQFASVCGNTCSPIKDDHSMAIRRKVYGNSGHETISPTESDSSGSKKLSKLRPYRPAGSRDVYYTESGDDTNESGTTIESTHPGSDDAIPPYIPTQYLGSRKDEPVKHPTGIYGNNTKDALSTIDEKSVGDDKEKALSLSTGSGKEDAGQRASRRDERTTTEAGTVHRQPDYQLRARSPTSERSRGTVSGSQISGMDTGYQTGAIAKSLSKEAMLEKQRDEARLRELELMRKLDSQRDKNLDRADLYPAGKRQENLERAGFKTRDEYLRDLEGRERYSEDKRDILGTTVRSDPGGSLEEHRDSHDLAEFKRLEPEPLYPQERIRYSRSRSETDLVAMSPAESQKYSSPMQPGIRFMELSSQPSPISHHDSLSHRVREPGFSREPVRHPAKEPVHPAETRTTERDLAYIKEGTNAGPGETRYPLELPRVPEQRYPMERPVVSDRDIQNMQKGEPVPSGREMNQPPPDKADRRQTKSPLHVREKQLERELEEMNKEIAAQVKEVQGKAETETEFEDNFPPSKKAQVLREVLEQEYIDSIPPNINDMWTRFKELKNHSQSESSLNSTRLDALSGLLENPAHHAVNSFLDEKTEEMEKRKLEEEKAERLKAERQAEIEREEKLSAEIAAKERSLKRQELKQRHGLSEEESNGSYTEVLMERERKEKAKDRQKKKEEKRSSKDRKTKTPESDKERKKSRKEKENIGKENLEGKKIHSKDRKKLAKNTVEHVKSQHSDSMDTLFSIPEDASFETSPTKSESELKARQKRHRHVIDPLMKKLRDKIKLQRDKIDKERRKELQRVEKLKKLEMLLTAKRKGKLSDKAIDVELQDVSSATSISQSESSTMFSEATLTAGSTTMESDGSSQGSTTLKDTTVEPPKLQYKKYPEKEAFSRREKFPETDTSVSHSDTSDFSNIVVERVPEKRSERKSSGKKAKSKEKKARIDEYGHKIRKDRKKKEVFGVEMSDELLAKQLRRYERYISPERSRKHRDVATMYPSPITVSPPSRRRLKEVYMKSEAIQTSPSVRSTSPCHSYDEVPVAPVPLMAAAKQRRLSPSPSRSSPVLHSTSRSPADVSKSRSSGSRKSSKSPSAAQTQTSILSPSSKTKTGSQTRRKKSQSPMWKPETPPKNQMFEPETPDENREPFTKMEDIPQGLSWFVPLKPSEPWRKPLKERQAFSVRQEPWEPKSVPQSTWKNIVHGDVLKDKSDISNVSRDTKFDLDTTGQPIRDEESMSESDESDEEIGQSKSLSKMTLQEAFLQRKQIVLSRLRERQKRLHLAAEERRMQAYLQLERDRLFQEERRKEANPEAHPYSDNLFKPARRVISKEEMKEMTKKKYQKLPEVVEQEKLKKRADQYSLNRLKARLFNRKVQRHVLVKAEKWGR